mmetsp:Transcript_66304/g.181839  ORF Transcript_66304/g.181839 Transcript_66304/m.181839 type:complete len:246 (-) Transcript_66304:683-1420(-)
MREPRATRPVVRTSTCVRWARQHRSRRCAVARRSTSRAADATGTPPAAQLLIPGDLAIPWDRATHAVHEYAHGVTLVTPNTPPSPAPLCPHVPPHHTRACSSNAMPPSLAAHATPNQAPRPQQQEALRPITQAAATVAPPAHAFWPLGTVVWMIILERSASRGALQLEHGSSTMSVGGPPGMMPSVATLKRSPKNTLFNELQSGHAATVTRGFWPKMFSVNQMPKKYDGTAASTSPMIGSVPRTQ